jgi:heme/copper-type cytochrome/quinol oxidase subunit 4
MIIIILAHQKEKAPIASIWRETLALFYSCFLTILPFLYHRSRSYTGYKLAYFIASFASYYNFLGLFWRRRHTSAGEALSD